MKRRRSGAHDPPCWARRRFAGARICILSATTARPLPARISCARHGRRQRRRPDQFRRWYAQAGTPPLRVRDEYDAVAGRYTLHVEAVLPADAGPAAKEPFVIPLAMGLLGEAGNLPLALAGGPGPRARTTPTTCCWWTSRARVSCSSRCGSGRCRRCCGFSRAGAAGIRFQQARPVRPDEPGR